jgi:hypothetical protein
LFGGFLTKIEGNFAPFSNVKLGGLDGFGGFWTVAAPDLTGIRANHG